DPPVEYLTTDTYLSWAPGTSDYSAAGSSIYITAVNDNTTVTVYNSAGIQICQDTDVDRLETFFCYDPDFDNTGAHIVASDKVAIAWGEDPRRAPMGNPGLDMGYTCLPIPPEWHTVLLEVNKTAAPTSVCIGDTTTFTINITVPLSGSSYPVNNIDLIDTLPPGWVYVSASPAPDSIAGTIITWNNYNWNLNPGQTQTIT